MIGIMVQQHTAVLPEPSQQQPPPTVWPRVNQGDTMLSHLHRTVDMITTRRTGGTCGVSTLIARLRVIQWPPNFKVSNFDKYEPKQDSVDWLAVYTIAA